MTILTGYINIKKENLKTDLNNETITKDDYDISLSELELKQKYEIGKHIIQKIHGKNQLLMKLQH